MKKLFCIVIAVAMVVGLVACSSAPTASETPSTEVSTSASAVASPTEVTSTEVVPVDFPEMTLTFSTPTAETEIHGKGAQVIAENLENATGGKIKMDIYFSNTLFPSDQNITAMLGGNLDITVSNGGGLSEYLPTLAMLDAGYTFNSLEHWKAFYNSDLWANLQEKIAEETGIRVLAVFSNGRRVIHLREDKRVTSRADLKDVKLRMPNSEAWLFLGKALGVNPIPLPGTEVYVGLQTGTIDGQDNPVSSIRGMSFYEVSKSVTMSGHVIATQWYVMSEDKWKTLSPEVQDVIKKAMQDGCDWTTEQSYTQEADDIAFLEDHGMSIYELTDDELKTYAQEVKDYYFNTEEGKELTSDWDMDLYNAIQDLAK